MYRCSWNVTLSCKDSSMMDNFSYFSLLFYLLRLVADFLFFQLLIFINIYYEISNAMYFKVKIDGSSVI